MQDKVEPRFNPDSIRESVRAPYSEFDDRLGALEASQEQPKGAGVLLHLVMLVLVLALGAMAWIVWEQRQTLTSTQQDLQRLEATLLQRSLSGLASEETLAGQLEQIQALQADAQVALGSDLTQLRDLVAAETKERQSLQQTLQQLQQVVSTQDTRIAQLHDRPQPADLTATVEALTANLRQLQADVQQVSRVGQDTNLTQQLQSVTAELTRIQTQQQQQAQEFTQLSQTLTEQRNQLQSLERQLNTRLERLQADLAKVSATPAPAVSSASSAELALIELSISELQEDIRAINNARQLINRDLLQLREQVNRIQLMLN